MATVQVRKGKTKTTYRVQYTKGSRRVSKSFRTKKEAEKFAALMLVDEDLSQSLTNPILTSLSFQDMVSEYLAQYTGRDQSAPQRLRYWGELFNTTPVGKISRARVRQELHKLHEGHSNATVNRYKAALQSLYRYLLNQYDIEHNPVKGIPMLKEDNARDRFLTDDEIQRLLSACRESSWDRLYLLVLLGITTGARRGELIERRWDDMNFTSRTLSTSKTKNDDKRVLPITPQVLEELIAFREKTGFVFPHRSKLDTYLSNFDYHWRKALKKAQIENFCFHDLRHTCASILAMNGASLIEISQVLGHKSITMTQRYAHLCVGHKQTLMNRVFSQVGESYGSL
ncbi:tyrosine-type recombinase/integrase [Vibrio breoganii]|uniref:tyrosine-type recombinase/integrase n=1 Tax=Vibrio breoganii TaxID=553239 RepID=UPI0002E31D1E|nr:site-specific integrase [Vibrio breoganii]OED95195.1 integrase [Vibrio breoganii ZF-55]